MVSFAAIGSPYTTWARLVSWFPATALFAMPNRIAMGAATWWDPVVAVFLTLAAIAGLVVLGGRVYAGAILHTGATLKLGEAWRVTTTSSLSAAGTRTGHSGTSPQPSRVKPAERATIPSADKTTDRWTNGALLGIGACLAAVMAALAHDVVIGLAVGAAFYAAATRIAKAWNGRGDRHFSDR